MKKEKKDKKSEWFHYCCFLFLLMFTYFFIFLFHNLFIMYKHTFVFPCIFSAKKTNE